MNNKIYQLIHSFVDLAIKTHILEDRDQAYVLNRLYTLIGLKPHPELESSVNNFHSLSEICKEIIKQLSARELERLGENLEQQEAELINTLLPPPSYIQDKFYRISASDGIKEALNWYYDFSGKTNYIKLADIAKNISWETTTCYGNIQITINLSKPEKDPSEITRAKLAEDKSTNYPMCLLCIENEGYRGTASKPARQNHRMLKLKLNNQDWYFQFSPYLYYPEHSIVLNAKHTDMIINQNTFKVFFDFVEIVPHYLIGSNSDIPIVGGSILTHDHFQAGNYVFPIEHAKVRQNYSNKNYPQVLIEHLTWPVSTIRLTGTKQHLLELSQQLIQKWYHYSSPELNIIPFSEQGIRHNAITPILRKNDDDNYSLYLMLRNNRTSSTYPDGIFHPHRHLHHIKKENIGLIEAMGVAILPGRLAYELAEIGKLLALNDKELAITELLFDEKLLKHEEWLAELYDKYGKFSESEIEAILKSEVSHKFSQVLENAGVFKLTPEGDLGMANFMASLAS